MASEKNPEEEEGKIPVLTVLKNESILKNIFIVNKPPPEDHSPRRRLRRDHEDILLVGRHPDCDLMLTHPSISRYHLHIRSVPSSLSFSVIDLSSAHGTWVSGRKIEAGVRVEMKEGDTLRIGVSSRVYRLHWIPISRAYDLENPFVPEMHALVQQQREEDDDDDDDDDDEQVGIEIEKELNSCPVEMEDRHSADSVLESINSLFVDENVELTVKEEEISGSSQMLEDNASFCCPDDKGEIQSVDSILECLKDEIWASPQMLKDNASFCCPDDKEEIQSVDSVLESINSLFVDENVEPTVKEKEISGSPRMLEDNASFCCPDDKEEIQSVDSILACLKDEIWASPQMLKDNASFCCPDDKEEIQSVDSVLESINSLFVDENVELTVKEEEISASPQMQEDNASFCCLDDKEEIQSVDSILACLKDEIWASPSFCCPDDKEEIQSVDSILECLNTLFLDENVEVTVKEEIPAAARMLEDIISLSHEGQRKRQSKDEEFGVSSEPFGSKAAYWPTPDVEDKQVVEHVNTMAINLSGGECLSAVESVSGAKMLQIQSPQDTFTSPLPHRVENSFEKHQSSFQVLSPAYVPESVVRCDNTIAENLYEDECLPVWEAVSGTEMLQFKSPQDTFTSSLLPHTENTFAEKLDQDECLPVPEAVSGTDMLQIKSPRDIFTTHLTPPLENSVEKHHSSFRVLMPTFVESFVEGDNNTLAEYLLEDESFPFLEAVPLTGMQQIQSPQESECTARDNGRTTDTLTAGAGILNSQNMFLPVEEVVPGTIFQQSKFIEEVAMDSQSDGENQDRCDQWHIPLQIESVNLTMTQEDLLNITNESQTPKPDMETLESCKETTEKSLKNRNIWSRRGKATSPPLIQTRQSVLKGSNADNEAAMSDENNMINKAISKDILSVLDTEEEIFTPDKENFRPSMLQLRFLKKSGKLEETKHSNSQRSHSSKDKTISKDLFSVLDGEKEEEIYTPDKENFSPNTLHLRRMKRSGKLEETKHSKSQRSCSSKDLFSVLDGENEEEEIYTPDKENFSPNTLHLRRMLKKGKPEEIKHSKSRWSPNPKGNFGPKIYSDESRSPTSNKENQTPKRVQDQKLQRKPFGTHIKLTQEHDVNALKNRVERVPFQSLKNSGCKGRSGTSCPVSAEKGTNVSYCEEISDKLNNPSDTGVVQKRSWDMIVDTTTLMNKESRKALQLLLGLKGTRLIVPRLVIRELQSMKQQQSFFRRFRRISEASLALEWVEECMVNTNWWIHIQSSMDEERRIAPTPPASPQTQICDESWSFHGGIGSSMEIPSPTIEDHILDFTLLHKRKLNDGQLVLLSEDVTLKINCMAEGLLCEPAQEFRESLVNPFSERFLWQNSSPRGQTWCCEDDVVLRERYCRLPLRKSSKGAASGLKLILLHNSQYGH